MAQNAANTIRLSPPSDERVIDLFARLQAMFGSGAFTLQAADASIGNFTGRDDALARLPKDVGTSFISAATYMTPGNIIISFRRAISEPSPGNPQYLIQTPSAYQNELSAYSNNQQVAASEPFIAVWSVLQAFAHDFRPTILEEATSSSTLLDALRLHVAEMSSRQLALLDEASQARSKAEAERRELLDQADEEIARRREANEAELEMQRSQLAQDRQALEAQQAQLDDSEHKFARRAMRQQITDDLKNRLEKPGVSREVRGSRMNILYLSLAGILALVGAVAWASIDLHTAFAAGGKDQLVILIAAVRVGLPAAGAVGLLAWLLGYQRQLAADDARVERDLERYRYDLDRASWVIETALEVQGQDGRTIPPDWMTGVTNNLFAVSEPRGEGTSALEALGSLLNFSGKLELGPTGSKLELSRGGLKRLAKSAAAEHGE